MLTRWLRDICYLPALLALSPLLLYRALFQKRYREGWGQRLGAVPRLERDKTTLWFHAVSVGEVNGLRTLLAELQQRLPEVQIVVSTTTDTGMARARELYGEQHRVFFFPWDFSLFVGRAFGRLRPDLCVLMEGDIWPNFMAIAQKRRVPVAVVNGRIGAGKGWPRYKRLRPLVKSMFARLGLVLAQEEEYARKFLYLGVAQECLRVTGSLKYDTADVSETVAGAQELGTQVGLNGAAPLWVCGSTGPGEEVRLLEVYRGLKTSKGLEGLRLVLVPRKPERFEEVAELVAAEGFKLLRYSHIKAGGHELSEDHEQAVILGDTMGDLRKFYALASVVFVGRSLVPMGGSDMMEAAALGKAVVVGPYADNFMDTVQKLLAGKGIEVAPDHYQLPLLVRHLLLTPKKAERLGACGREVILENRGATRLSADSIQLLLQKTLNERKEREKARQQKKDKKRKKKPDVEPVTTEA